MTGLIPSVATAAVASLFPIAAFTPVASEAAVDNGVRESDLSAMLSGLRLCTGVGCRP